MPISAKTGFDSVLAMHYLASGVPLKPYLSQHPTFALLLGKPKEIVTGGVAGYEFERNAMNNVKRHEKYLKLPIRGAGSSTAAITRANLAVAQSPGAANDDDMREVVTTYLYQQMTIRGDKLEEGAASGWDAAGSFEQWKIDGNAEQFVRDVSAALWLNTGAACIQGDGILGSIPAGITDGLTAVARTYGPNDVAYANFLNGTRSTEHQAQVANGGAASFNLDMGSAMALKISQYAGGEAIYAPMSFTRFARLAASLLTTYGSYEITQAEKNELNLNVNQAIKNNGVIYYPDADVPASANQYFFTLDAMKFGIDYKQAEMRQVRLESVPHNNLFDVLYKGVGVVWQPKKTGVIYNCVSE